jgi:hypothetical protein
MPLPESTALRMPSLCLYRLRKCLYVFDFAASFPFPLTDLRMSLILDACLPHRRQARLKSDMSAQYLMHPASNDTLGQFAESRTYESGLLLTDGIDIYTLQIRAGISVILNSTDFTCRIIILLTCPSFVTRRVLLLSLNYTLGSRASVSN